MKLLMLWLPLGRQTPEGNTLKGKGKEIMKEDTDTKPNTNTPGTDNARSEASAEEQLTIIRSDPAETPLI